jgi:hypothetical protein
MIMMNLRNTWLRSHVLTASRILAPMALACLGCVSAFCQSASPDPVKQKLQDEKDKANLQKAIADGQKSIAESDAARSRLT